MREGAGEVKELAEDGQTGGRQGLGAGGRRGLPNNGEGWTDDGDEMAVMTATMMIMAIPVMAALAPAHYVPETCLSSRTQSPLSSS